ncbi:MAG: putative DNA-binding domain-containing protein, partial [Myxococcales bacterium]|nr:putative DNA-binding domain-containing protein [Myxococcales bacterium]
MTPRPLSAPELHRLRAMQRVLRHAVSTADRADIAEQQRTGYPALELPSEDAHALAAQDERRIAVYRKLVRGTLVDVVAAQIPRVAARLGEARYEALVHRFVTEELPRSQVLRDVAFELVAWAAAHGDTALSLDAPFLLDLARYELFEFDVHAAPRRALTTSDDIAADQPVAFDTTVRIAELGHRVHELPDDATDRSVPVAEPVTVLAYRDAEGRFRQLTLTPLCGAILVRMWRHATPLATAVGEACRAADTAVTPEVITGTAQVLEDLAERGALLGGLVGPAPPPPSPFAHWLLDGQRAD